VVAAQAIPELFATVVLAWIDPAARSAALLSAGHPPPLLVGRGVHRVQLRPYLPLGVERRISSRPTTIKLPRCWTLFFYTDGLIEGRAAPGSPERYGEERLMRRLQQFPAGRFDAEARDRLLAEVEAANGAAFGDDVAVVAVSGKRTDEVQAKA
jgi:serine phosphatase RsbU (regulator of sigma subunit)